ncbi:MAG TPA: carboxypeptidase-like regulatory domain-containing protein [Pyrinomonadaceae bacterium]|nr:carboxypeptidase-like regulatory domain-containing protein [Pyrinomonadaceae bacterium]
MFKGLLTTLCISLAVAASSDAQSPPAATNAPQYVIQKQVIASGGGTMTSATYTVESTISQPTAGIQESTETDTAYVGFWIPEMLSPTAASATVSGRVITPTGQAVAFARLTLTDMTGHNVTALTGQFGYFRFENVPSGQAYVLSISSKQYHFAQPAIMVNVGEDVTDVVFTSIP